MFDTLAKGLHDPEPVIRRLASAGLMKLKHFPVESLVLLPDGLRDPDPQVCANLAHVCSRLEALPAEVATMLLGHTSSPDDGLRLSALRALSDVPVVGDEPLLERLLADSNLQIALQAADVLLQRSPETPGLEEVFVRCLKAGVMFREHALRVLDSTEPNQPGVRTLLERLSQRVGDASVREHLARLLSRPGNVATVTG
jgi:hypothetical protein